VRVLKYGAHMVSDAELLAVILRSGNRDHSTVGLAREALTACGGLRALIDSAAGADLFTGEQRARIAAAKEIVRRALLEDLSGNHDALASPRACHDYLRLSIAGKEHEVFLMLFLDARLRVTACEELFRGTLLEVNVYPREVVKAALRHNAAAVVFAHNHPSGVAEPSPTDEILTRSLQAALATVDIKVLDHFVVAGGTTVSFAERGLL
jgi:DNA repair protein RadC